MSNILKLSKLSVSQDPKVAVYYMHLFLSWNETIVIIRKHADKKPIIPVTAVLPLYVIKYLYFNTR